MDGAVARLADGDRAQSAASPERTERTLILQLDGYAGPLDVLLDLVRAQKVDVAEISILELANQYLAFIAAARRAELSLAAEYLVMAAWLAFLKSRLLLPKPSVADEASAEQMAAALTRQLQRLEAVRRAAAALAARPRCRVAYFPRGETGTTAAAPPRGPLVRPHLNELVQAYVRLRLRRARAAPLTLQPFDVWSVDDAIAHLRAALGCWPGWENLDRYLPSTAGPGAVAAPLNARSKRAAVFAASLELARQGALRLRQSTAFGALYVKPRQAGEASDDG